jgi:predicted PolB exonuclease-like 3'-5' exonuclease
MLKLESILENTADYLASLGDNTKITEEQDLSQAHGCDFDIVAAIQRQLKFSYSMYNANYLKSRFADNILENAIDRYEKFFTLIAENPGVGIAPTQDIDLVW